MRVPISRAAAAAGAAFLALLVAGPAVAGTPEAQLLRTYQPVTVFDPAELLRPTKVQSFIADSSLEQLVGDTWVLAEAQVGPGNLPGPGTGTWRLNQNGCTPAAFLGGLQCYADAWSAGSGGDAVYGRVVRAGGTTVLQYWYFYYDNTYSYAYPPSDFIWQAHEGDWELVSVVLDPEGTPLFAGYSQHCLGQRRAWAGVTRRGTHPVVYVAAGSHANYFAAGVQPWNPQCVPPEVQALLRQFGLPLPVDRTGEGDEAGPPELAAAVTPLHGFGNESGWLGFDGFWGEREYLHAPFVGTFPFGHGPVGPAYKPVWSDPLGTMALWPEG